MKVIWIDRAPGAGPATGPGEDAEAIIRQARRRQRKRRLLAGLAAAATAAAVLGLLAGLQSGGSRPGGPPRDRVAVQAPVRTHPTRQALAGPVLGGGAGSVLMDPANPASDDQAYLVDLGTGHVSLAHIPHGIDLGDYDPYLIRAGRWVVYVSGGGRGTFATRGDLRGRARMLGRSFEFLPAAAPGRVWLVTNPMSNPGRGVKARLLPVAGGPPGPAVRTPPGSYLAGGTDAGLLLITRHRDLELWTPGYGTPVTLAHLPGGADDGFAVGPRLVTYGTGCRGLGTSAKAEFQFGYQACRTLRARNVVTGASYSFPAPPGTAGWAPPGFNMDDVIAPGDTMIAAEAVVHPRQGLVRVFVLHLGGAYRRTTVPHSVGFFPRTAWSSDGKWLLYQGPGKRLWAYRVATGTVRSSTIPCCWYTVMTTVPPRAGAGPGRG